MSAGSHSEFSMGGFSILNNRKRAIVALVHSVVFLLIAVRQMGGGESGGGIWVPSLVTTGTWILCAIFVIVSSISCGCSSYRADGWRSSIRVLHDQRDRRGCCEPHLVTKAFMRDFTSG